MTTTVRTATIDDVDELMALRRAVAAEERWIGAELPLDEDRDRATLVGGAERGSVFVAEVDGEVVGYVGLHLAPYLVVDLGMMVKDGFRGQGVGSALMVEAVAWAKAARAHKMALQHWPDNERARALYEKFGFEQEGYLRRHYPRKNGELWDAVIMGLVLDA